MLRLHVVSASFEVDSRVICVSPGLVVTPMASSSGMSAAVRIQQHPVMVLRVEGAGWVICSAVRLFLSYHARQLIGQTFAIDDGVTLSAAPVCVRYLNSALSAAASHRLSPNRRAQMNSLIGGRNKHRWQTPTSRSQVS